MKTESINDKSTKDNTQEKCQEYTPKKVIPRNKMEVAIQVLGVLAGILLIVGGVFTLIQGHRDYAIWIFCLAAVLTVIAAFCWMQDRAWKSDAEEIAKQTASQQNNNTTTPAPIPMKEKAPKAANKQSVTVNIDSRNQQGNITGIAGNVIFGKQEDDRALTKEQKEAILDSINLAKSINVEVVLSSDEVAKYFGNWFDTLRSLNAPSKIEHLFFRKPILSMGTPPNGVSIKGYGTNGERVAENMINKLRPMGVEINPTDSLQRSDDSTDLLIFIGPK